MENSIVMGRKREIRKETKEAVKRGKKKEAKERKIKIMEEGNKKGIERERERERGGLWDGVSRT